MDNVDSTENYNEKMLILTNAKHRINQLADYLRTYQNYEFKNVYKKINDSLEYLRSRKEFGAFNDISETEKSKEPTPKPDLIFEKTEIAMYYYYLIKAGYRKQMGYEDGEGGKVKALTYIAAQHGFSYKAFQLAFNKINNHKASNWITGSEQNLKNFQTIIGMLTEYPNAKIIAQYDLEQAETKGDKRGNPVT